jgi:hypothetical protein
MDIQRRRVQRYDLELMRFTSGLYDRVGIDSIPELDDTLAKHPNINSLLRVIGMKTKVTRK